MPDPRTTNVQRYREEQGAARIHLLTAIAPFTVSQDRFIVVEAGEVARLVSCSRCTPRTVLGQGQAREVAPETLVAFQRGLAAAEAAWAQDAVPPNVHDGVTITAEYADAGIYRRVRMVAPPEGSPHARLLAAWLDAFPEVRRALR